MQGELEAALAVLTRESTSDISLVVGGRTDAGVHARGQVAHLDVRDDQLDKLVSGTRGARRVNGVLRRSAPDVVVHAVGEAPDAFDARFSALRRRYEYRLRAESSRRDPLTARFTADVPRDLDLHAMRRASESMLGLNDFTTFCKPREGATAVRTLLDFSWRETEDGALAARIEADAFCHSMVRSLVGAVVAVGSGRITDTDLSTIMDARQRTSTFTVMPAHGLSLEEIAYPPQHELAARAEQTRARRPSLQ